LVFWNSSGDITAFERGPKPNPFWIIRADELNAIAAARIEELAWQMSSAAKGQLQAFETASTAPEPPFRS
jgi:hypothetical protein